MKQNKKQKQTLESAQYGREIIFEVRRHIVKVDYLGLIIQMVGRPNTTPIGHLTFKTLL